MRDCYKCVTKQDHPFHDDGETNHDHDHEANKIDWYKEAREAMEERRDVRDKG